jgi:hypothetical protein
MKNFSINMKISSGGTINSSASLTNKEIISKLPKLLFTSKTIRKRKLFVVMFVPLKVSAKLQAKYKNLANLIIKLRISSIRFT